MAVQCQASAEQGAGMKHHRLRCLDTNEAFDMLGQMLIGRVGDC